MKDLKYLCAAIAVSCLVVVSGFSPTPADHLVDTDSARNRAPTALIAAVESGQLDRVAELLDDGASANEAAPDGWTPLMSAAALGRPDLVRELLAVGADPNARADDGWTAMLLAVQSGNEEVVLTLADLLERDRPVRVVAERRRR